MKQWEQIIFAIALAALGYVLYQFNGAATSKNKNAGALGPFQPGSVPAFYSYNTINTVAGVSPNVAAASVPIQPDSVGQANANGYLNPMETLFPYNSNYGG